MTATTPTMTRGQALDAGSRAIIRDVHAVGHRWTWTRCEPGRTAWIVTAGGDRPYFRAAVPYDGADITVAPA